MNRLLVSCIFLATTVSYPVNSFSIENNNPSSHNQDDQKKLVKDISEEETEPNLEDDENNKPQKSKLKRSHAKNKSKEIFEKVEKKAEGVS